MANDEHVALLKQGVTTWNAWREENPNIRPDLSGANLSRARLGDANLGGANLGNADLRGANLHKAHLNRADLSGAKLYKAKLSRADLSRAYLIRANLTRADLSGANLSDANLSRAYLIEARLGDANLSEADLHEADLSGADLTGASLLRANLGGSKLSEARLGGTKLVHANLRGSYLIRANLSGADLESATLVDTDLTGADLTGCRIYGVSAWGLKLEDVKQHYLIVTRLDEPDITVDNIEVAQFIYLLLHNEKIRDVIDTITSKVVLILGRFTAERKAVLDALRGELRKRDYLPILFDFEVPARRNITETVTLLARMARFIIADLTDPSSIPQELQAIIPSVRVPIQPLLLEGSSLYSMFKDFDPQDFHWVLPVYRYKEPEQLLATLAEKVIAPAEGKVQALAERRRMIEAELTKPQ